MSVDEALLERVEILTHPLGNHIRYETLWKILSCHISVKKLFCCRINISQEKTDFILKSSKGIHLTRSVDLKKNEEKRLSRVMGLKKRMINLI